MATDSLPDLSPDQAYAHKFAGQELAKYCQEFSYWRNTRRAFATLDQSVRLQGPLGTALKKPPLPTQHST
jgi:hypothetical protein